MFVPEVPRMFAESDRGHFGDCRETTRTKGESPTMITSRRVRYGGVLVVCLLAVLLAYGAAAAVELTVWSFRGQEIPEDVLRAFEAANPGVTVEQQFPAGDMRGEGFIVASAAGVPPDLIHLNEDFLPMYVANDLVAPITKYIDQGLFGSTDVYFPGVVDPYEGEIYFVPHRQSANTLLYNRTLFSEGGFDADNPPGTWDEFNAVARRMTVVSGDTLTKVGAAFRTSSGTLTSWFQPMLWQAGGDLFEDGRININTDAGREALEFFTQAVTEGYGVEGDAMFREGNAAMLWQGWSALVRQYRDSRGMDFVDIGPVLQHKDRAGYGSLAGWVVPKGPNVELAAELLAFSLKKENVVKFLQATYFLPVRSDIGLDYFGPKDQVWAQKFVPQQAYMRFDILHPAIRDLQPLLARALRPAVSGGVPPSNALADAERQANALLAEKGY